MTEAAALVRIASDQLTAEIDPAGAQLFTLRDASGADLLWDGDPRFWTGRAPILFPIVGMLEGGQYRLDGQSYALPQHGFARHSVFELVEAGASQARFRLRANEETLRVYPFHFELDLRFSVTGPKLTIAASIRNRDDRAMPASLGFHPALRWPLPYGRPRADHAILFDRDEPAAIRRINHEGVVKPEAFPSPIKGRDLPLTDALFENGALIFDRIESRKVSYGAQGGPRIEVEFPDTPYLGIWTKPGADFVCIEPWHGIADPVGFDGDFRSKPGVFEVAVGATYEIEMSLALVDS